MLALAINLDHDITSTRWLISNQLDLGVSEWRGMVVG